MVRLNTDTIRTWRKDILAFVEQACPIRRPDDTVGPPRWSPRQVEWLRAISAREADGSPVYPTCAIISPKRTAKTLVGACCLLHASLRPDRLSHCLGQSETSSQSLSFTEASKMVEGGPLSEIATVARGEIAFPSTGTKIVALPCSSGACAGRTTTGLALSDELWVPGRQGVEAWQLLVSQVNPLAQSLTVSQSAGEESFIYRLRQIHESGEDPSLWVDWVPLEWIRANSHINPYLDETWLRRERLRLGDAIFRVWHENEVGEPAAGAFPTEDVARCFTGYRMPRTRDEVVALVRQFGGTGAFVAGCGLDRALPFRQTEGDATSWSTLVKFLVGGVDHLLLVQHEWSPTGGESEVLGWWRKACFLVGGYPATICEAYQCGDIVGKIQNATLGSPTTQGQQILFGNLTAAIGEGRLHISGECSGLRAEMDAFKVNTEGPLCKWSAPSGKHDDRMYGLAWSASACWDRGIGDLQIWL